MPVRACLCARAAFRGDVICTGVHVRPVNAVADGGAVALAKAVSVNRGLKVLDLTGNAPVPVPVPSSATRHALLPRPFAARRPVACACGALCACAVLWENTAE